MIVPGVARKQPEKTMTAQELIEILKTYPADLRVVVNGYETGYDDLESTSVRLEKIALNAGKEDYEGGHESARFAKKSNCKVVEALVLPRKSF